MPTRVPLRLPVAGFHTAFVPIILPLVLCRHLGDDAVGWFQKDVNVHLHQHFHPPAPEVALAATGTVDADQTSVEYKISRVFAAKLYAFDGLSADGDMQRAFTTLPAQHQEAALRGLCSDLFANAAAAMQLTQEYIKVRPAFIALAVAEVKAAQFDSASWYDRPPTSGSPAELRAATLASLVQSLRLAFTSLIRGHPKDALKEQAYEERMWRQAAQIHAGNASALDNITTTTPNPMGGQLPNVFRVSLGACTVDSAGCILSPGYPGNYSNRETCVIEVDRENARPLSVQHFDTEDNYDTLMVNGARYSGSNGPSGIIPTQEVVWHTDHHHSAGGWMICTLPPMSGPLEPEDTASDAFTVVLGNCTIDADGCVASPNFPEPYDNSGHCTIAVDVSLATPINVSSFETEGQFDTLTINNQDYYGDTGPVNVVPSGNITWTSDATFPSAGWRICPTHLSKEVSNENLNTSVFTVRSGGCSVNAAGCAFSPHLQDSKGPDDYDNLDSCVISVKTHATGPLLVKSFRTEQEYDYLLVNGIRYSGMEGPQGVHPYEDIVWYADSEIHNGGWEICPTPPGKLLPVMNALQVFTVTSGNCSVDSDGCAVSPQYPQSYPANEGCSISVAIGNTLPIQVADLMTHDENDYLQVNGRNYSLHDGPDGVVPSKEIRWVASSGESGLGWRLCPVADPELMLPTTTTTTTPARDPWQELQQDEMLVASVNGPLGTVQSVVEEFLDQAELFRQSANASVLSSEDMLSRTHLLDLASDVNGTLQAWSPVMLRMSLALDGIVQALQSAGRFRDAIHLGRVRDVELQEVNAFMVFIQKKCAVYANNIGSESPEIVSQEFKLLRSSIESLRMNLEDFQQAFYGAFQQLADDMNSQLSSIRRKGLLAIVRKTLKEMPFEAMGMRRPTLMRLIDSQAQAKGETVSQMVQSALAWLAAHPVVPPEDMEAALASQRDLPNAMEASMLEQEAQRVKTSLADVLEELTVYLFKVQRAAWALQRGVMAGTAPAPSEA